MKVLFVCTGNTCRSPMAEGILKILAKDDDTIKVLSGGLLANEGSGASENAILAAKELGIDISSHRAANVNPDAIAQADIILTMTEAHKSALIDMYGADPVKTYTVMEYAGFSGDIADPYGGDLDVYRRCAKQLSEAVSAAYKKMRGGAL